MKLSSKLTKARPYIGTLRLPIAGEKELQGSKIYNIFDLCKELDFDSEEFDQKFEIYLKFVEEGKGKVNIKDLLSAYIWKDRVVLVGDYQDIDLFRLYRVNDQEEISVRVPNEDQEEKSDPSDLGNGGLGNRYEMGRKQRNKRMRTKKTKKVRKTKKVKKNKDSKNKDSKKIKPKK